jgi:mannose-6-phosphate isomerase-like protein (cupin superfamily)
MKRVATGKHRGSFAPLHATRSSQAAMMTLAPGAKTQEQSTNEHAWAEQWLYVISGTGKARVGKRTVKLRAGDLLLIEKREPHQIHNTGRHPLRTVNIYSPPAYGSDGEPLAKRGR